MPTPAARTAGKVKSNICRRSKPSSSDTDTTSRFVEVPIVVLMPPMIVANPIGIRIFEVDTLVRCATPTRIGRSITTIGVLLANALTNAAITSVTSKAMTRLNNQNCVSRRPIGRKPPLTSTPLARMSSRQIVISASLPKPSRKCAPRNGEGPARGNNSNTMTIVTRIAVAEYSSRMRSREKRIKAKTVSARAAIA